MTQTVCRHFSIVALTILVSGCSRIGSTPPQSNDSRFELQRDTQGRLIRLDRVTGEMVLIDGTRLKALPADSNVKRPQTVSRRSEPSMDKTDRARSVPIATPTLAGGTTPLASVVLAAATASPGNTVALTAAAPVFLTPTSSQTPLRVLPAGSVVTVIAIEDRWYRVEFNDEQWGRRVGYVAKASTTPTSPTHNRSLPVDLSVRDPQPPTQSEPIDLSIREHD
jgi:hypothetical protein